MSEPAAQAAMPDPTTEIKDEEIDIPVIRVEDWEEDPPIAEKYICGDNEIDCMAVYRRIKRLPHHPGRGHYVIYQDGATRSKSFLSCLDRHQMLTMYRNATR